jgi:rhodanese-related sulfurtransferase
MNKTKKRKGGFAKSLFEIIFGLIQKRKFKKISASEFLEMRKFNKDITILDCRDKDDYEESHLDDAINIPYQGFMKNWHKAAKTKTVITICYVGMYGRVAAQKVASSGNHTAYTVIGGMVAVNKLIK